MIRIGDRRNCEYAGVGEHLEVDGCISAFGNRNGYSGADLVAAKGYRLGDRLLRPAIVKVAKAS